MACVPAGLPDAWPPPYPLHRPLLASEARALDGAAEQAGLPPLVLMEHAARAVAALSVLMDTEPRARTVILCGAGNNGGDGYGAARVLASWGRSVRVLRLAPAPQAGPARVEHDLCAQGLPVEDGSALLAVLDQALAEADLVVDALFGVGLDRPLSPFHVDVVQRVNAARALRLAVDVPSGLDADRGVPLPVCVAADVTATMAAPKRGLAPGAPGARFAGRVVEVDIGLPWALHAPFLAQ